MRFPRTNLLTATLAAGAVLLIALTSVALLPNDTPEREQAAPTTTRPPTCAKAHDLPEGTSCARIAKDYQFAAAVHYVEQIAFIAWTEAAWQAELARQAAAQPSYGGTSYGGECGGGNWVIPEYIVQRESGCSYDAYNATGCDGQGCIGAYQLHAQHFNGGACSDLGTDPAGQDECAARLWNGGAGAGNWAATL